MKRLKKLFGLLDPSIEIYQGQMIPAWYGIAWHRFDRDAVVCFPMPLNVVASVLRSIWIWFKWGHIPAHSSVRDAYDQGIQDGMKRGYAKGYDGCLHDRVYKGGREI